MTSRAPMSNPPKTLPTAMPAIAPLLSPPPPSPSGLGSGVAELELPPVVSLVDEAPELTTSVDDCRQRRQQTVSMCGRIDTIERSVRRRHLQPKSSRRTTWVPY